MNENYRKEKCVKQWNYIKTLLKACETYKEACDTCEQVYENKKIEYGVDLKYIIIFAFIWIVVGFVIGARLWYSICN